jgi:ribose transport system ATP-binding protein
MTLKNHQVTDGSAGTPGSPAPILDLRGVTKSFGHTYALRGVDLDIKPGEIHALVGHNGSGKSTLVKLMAGYHSADKYEDARVAGAPLDLGNALAARTSGLRFVHQELGLVDSLDAVENVLLGQPYPMRARISIDWRTSRRQVSAAFERLQYDVSLDKPVGELSLQDKTTIAIARALYGQDNAAAAVDKLFQVIDGLKKHGIGILYISHHLDEIFSIGDRVSVLRNGNMVATRRAAGLHRDELVELMVGDIAAAHEQRVTRKPEFVAAGPVLEVRGVGSAATRGISFVAGRGEIVGIAGLGGSGREELAAALFGAIPRSGLVKIDGVEVPAGNPSTSIEAGMGLLTADRASTGAFPEWSLARNVTLPKIGRSLQGLFLDRRREHGDVSSWLDRLGVNPSDPAQPLKTLSGGNQQRVLLARWLRATRRVVILDEPTQGVDVGAIRRIYAAIDEFAREGTTFVVCSSDAEELALLCDRVLVMAGGEIVRELCEENVNREAIDRACLELPRDRERELAR